MLDVVLALDGVADVIELFEIDEAFQSVPFGEAIDKSGTMLEYAADKIARHADVQDAVWGVGQNINESTAMRIFCKTWMAGTSPAMTN